MYKLLLLIWFGVVLRLKLSAGSLGGSVGYLADFSSGHDLPVHGFGPHRCADSSEPGACLRFCVSLSFSTELSHSLSVSLKNKQKTLIKKRLKLSESSGKTFFFKFIYFEWEKAPVREGQRERERASRAFSTELHVGFELQNHKIMTWAEVRCLTNWASQVPQKVLKF